MPYPPQGFPPAKTILEKSSDEMAVIFERVNDVEYLALFTNNVLSVSLAASVFSNANLSVRKLANIFGHSSISDSKVTSIFNLMTRAVSDLASVFNDDNVQASRAAYVTQNTSKDTATLALIFNDPNLTVSKAASILNDAGLSASKVASILNDPNLTVSKAASILNDPNLTVSKAAAIFNDANLTASRIASILNSDNMSASKAASILNDTGLSVSKVASILDDPNLSASKARQIFNNPNLSDSKATSIYDSMVDVVRKIACIGSFEKLFDRWTYVVINAAGGYAWQQVTDYAYEGACSARLYGYSHYNFGRDHRSKAYLTSTGVASKKIRVKSYEVSVFSNSYGASYGIYAKFGNYAIYWIIAYSAAAAVPDLAPNVASRNASVTAIGNWKEAVTDVTIASAFSAAGYPVPTDSDTVEIGVACRASDGPGVCDSGIIDVRFDLFEVI